MQEQTNEESTEKRAKLIAAILKVSPQQDCGSILKTAKEIATIKNDGIFESYRKEDADYISPIPGLVEELIAQDGLSEFLSLSSIGVEFSHVPESVEPSIERVSEALQNLSRLN